MGASGSDLYTERHAAAHTGLDCESLHSVQQRRVKGSLTPELLIADFRLQIGIADWTDRLRSASPIANLKSAICNLQFPYGAAVMEMLFARVLLLSDASAIAL